MKEEQILEALRKVKYPGYTKDIVSFGMVKEINFHDNGTLTLVLEIVTKDPEIPKKIENAVMDTIRKEFGKEVKELDLRINLAKGDEQKGKEADNPFEGQHEIAGTKYAIAVASGKGGVGKSLVAVNIASALSSMGFKVAIMDADVYGPNVPMMLGVVNERPKATEDKKIVPIEKFGMQIISMGFFVEEGTPIIWRSSLVNKLLEQFMDDVLWDDRDFIIMDLPPGTGDIQLTIAQKAKLTGSIIVSTPQSVALSDVTRGTEMFNKVNIPVLGLVENMSYFICPKCGERTDIFSHGGAKAVAEKVGIPFLGELPLDPELRELSDSGTPIVIKDPDSNASKVFFGIAEQLLEILKIEKK